MFNVFNPRNFVLAFAVTGFSCLSLSAMSGTANAALADTCHAGPRNSVVMCCNHYTKQYGKPLWMQENGSSCQAAVICSHHGKSNQPVALVINKKSDCWYEPIITDKQGSPGEMTTRYVN
jgi:hypothetical protein